MKSDILIVSALFPPEPVVSASLSYDIALKLAENYRTTVLSPRPSRPYGKKFGKTVKSEYPFRHVIVDSFTCAPSNILGRFRESISFGIATAKYIEQNKNEIKIIYANTWPLFAQYLLAITAKKNQIPVVLHVHDIYPESLAEKLNGWLKKIVLKVFIPLDKSTLEKAEVIIGISPKMIDYLRHSRRLDNTKFELVRNWQNDSVFEASRSDNKKEELMTFMYLGSVSPSARVDTIIQGFHKAGIENCRLIIAGSGSDKERCMSLVERSGMKNITFCEISFSETADLQSKADVLFLPLRKGVSLTATPSKLTAYMLSGKPVVACVEVESDVGTIIRSARCGFISEPENDDELAKLMKQIADMQSEQLLKMGENARTFALDHLSKKKNLEKLVSVIRSLHDRN